MMMQDAKCKVISNEKIADGIFKMILALPDGFNEKCYPGQFAELQIPGCGEHILRRPISINSASDKDNTVTFVYQVVGKGTDKLSVLKKDTEMMVILPLGNGFIGAEGKNILMVGAGIGAAPLKYYAQMYSKNNITAVLGFRNTEKIYQQEDFEDICEKVIVCTDDGSNGVKSYAASMAKKEAQEQKYDLIISCGPNIVLSQVAQFANEMEIDCQVSMEARMGCGVGACMGCNVTVRDKNGKEYYKRCCTEGPVFDSKEVVF